MAKRAKREGEGRPTKYNNEISLAAQVCYEHGYTDKQVAEKCGVTETTINNWKIKYPEFFESIKLIKDIADKEVEDSLFKRAKGFRRTVQKIDKDGSIHELEEELPPDPTSCIFWLKNRQPDKWREKQQFEHSGEFVLPQLITEVIKKSDD